MQHSLTSVDVKEVKKKITAAIKLYHRDHRQEAEDFYAIVEIKRRGLWKDTGEHYDGGDHAIERALFEMPENLYALVVQNLEPEQFVWFKTKEGGRWFARTFRKYALVEV